MATPKKTVEASNTPQDSDAGILLNLPIESIEGDPNQPRTEEMGADDDTTLNDLADSIKADGLLQPILVRAEGSDKYRIIAGHRRHKAAQIAGLTHIPAIVKGISNDKDILVAQLVENIQRKNLSAKDIVRSVSRFAELYGMSYREIGHVLGRSKTWVAQVMAVSKDPVAQKALDDHIIMDITAARMFENLPDVAKSSLIAESHRSGSPITRGEIKLILGNLRQKAPDEATPIPSHTIKTGAGSFSPDKWNEPKEAVLVIPPSDQTEPISESLEEPVPSTSPVPDRYATPMQATLPDMRDEFSNTVNPPFSVYKDFSGVWVVRVTSERLASVFKKTGIDDTDIKKGLEHLFSE